MKNPYNHIAGMTESERAESIEKIRKHYDKLYSRDGYLGKRKKHNEPLPGCTCYDGECPYSDYCTDRDINYCILDDMRGDNYDSN